MKILLFGILADIAGVRQPSLSLQQRNHSAALTVRDVWDSLVKGLPPLSVWVEQNPSAVRAIAVAVNQEYAQWESVLHDGDEIAFLPPVAGGSEPFLPPADAALPFVAVTPLAVAVDPLIRMVTAPETGAVALFAGTVREFTGPERTRTVLIEYEAYAGMAERVLKAIAAEVTEKWTGARVALVHRVGALLPGEVSVVVAVATPHRADAFEACRHAMERLKAEVPIWKKEHGEGGAVWVGWQGA